MITRGFFLILLSIHYMKLCDYYVGPQVKPKNNASSKTFIHIEKTFMQVQKTSMQVRLKTSMQG